MTISLGYQIPNFSYPGGVETLFDTVLAQAREAESSGFDTVLVMDHFYQLPGLGTPDQPMMEAYSTLAALAASTSGIQLSALVTGNTYRNPTLLAKTVSTLDVISHGRAILGIGAGWFELEHEQLGFDFDTFTERFEKLDEALQIIHPMLRDERPEFVGTWYRAHGAMNVPRFRESIPIMLGGQGERKTFRLAARYADHMNIICAIEDLPHKVEVLRQRAEEIDRDPATLRTSYLASVGLVETQAEADAILAKIPEDRRNRAFVGTADVIAERIQESILGAGVDGVVVNAPLNGHVPGVVSALGEALAPLVR
ncbi:LLM class F420-dependent oxidoreductase [Humibacter ginsenosidimutans]|uniref:LLM class F420-dependent oxidoreductase n=1 Tax=Humibacter ginsenosidimutans TaxID=2599293 RepID=A0A5B8M5X8_9MICO|nr:LLM class F420-dependent oxidoreductase [Humibacter ginsenosidimutans]QDZ15354.1 LLM class F420-dependent oxidoreductase [Humibacter ginsenosidimutans]